MATRSSVNDDANALCYVWLTFALLIVSSVCFATSAAEAGLIYAGIFFFICAFITATAYLTRYCAKSHGRRRCDLFCMNENTGCCCCKRCCNQCWRSILCLSPTDSPPPLAISRRDRHRLSIIHTANSVPHRATVSSTGDIYIVPVEDTTIARLNSLEQEIHRLRQQYEFLQRQDCVDTVVEQDYITLDAEEAKLFSWRESIVPSELQLRSMKGRLKRIARNFRLARTRLYNQNNGVNANMQNGFQLDVDMDAPEQVRIFATDVPVPPAYSEEDPEPSSTLRHSKRPAYTPREPEALSTVRHSVHPVYTIQESSPSISTQTMHRYSTDLSLTPVDNLDYNGGVGVRTSFAPSTSGAYQNAAFIGHLSGSSESLAPPLDDRGAPPPYDEATASPV